MFKIVTLFSLLFVTAAFGQGAQLGSLRVDSLFLNDNTIETQGTDVNLLLVPNGNGVSLIKNLDVVGISRPWEGKSQAELDALEATATERDVYYNETTKRVNVFDGTEFVEMGGTGTVLAEDVEYDNAISGLSGVDVQEAIDETDERVDALETDIATVITGLSDHLADTTDAHDASAISNVPSGNLAATDQQTANNELQSDIDTRATSAALTAHETDTTSIHGITDTADLLTTTNTKDVSGKRFTDSLQVAEVSTPVTPSSGYGKVYFKADGNLYTLNDAGQETIVGSGAGGSRLNLPQYPSFENGQISEGTCTNCSLATEPTNVLATANNAASLKITATSSSATYIVDKTTSSQWHTGMEIVKWIWAKTTATDAKFISRINGADESGVEYTLVGDGAWHAYKIFTISGTTSNGYKISLPTNASIVYLDEVEVRPMLSTDMHDVNQSSFVGSVTWPDATDANCLWGTQSSTFAVFADDADCDNVARTVVGNVTDVSAGLKPQIAITNARTDGVYRVVYEGNIYKAGGSNSFECGWRVVGDANGNQLVVGSTNASVKTPNLSFEGIRFTSAGTKTVQLQVRNSTNTAGDLCHIDVRSAGLKISAYFHPDQTSTVFAQQGKESCFVGASGNDGEAITANTEDIPFKTEDTNGDNCAAWDNSGNTGGNTNDAFTPIRNGKYSIAGNILTTATGSPGIRVYENGSELAPCGAGSGTTAHYFSCIIDAVAGRRYTLRLTSTLTLDNSSPFNKIRIQEYNPSTLVGTFNASQIVSEVYRYTSDAGGNIGAAATRNFEDFDSTTSRGPGITNTSGVYSGFRAGRWRINVVVGFASGGTWADGNTARATIQKNGSDAATTSYTSGTNSTSTASIPPLSTVLYNDGDDDFRVELSKSGTAAAANTTAGAMVLEFEYVGQ